MFHDEIERASSLATGKAMADVLGRRHHKRGRAVVVEWAKSLQVGAGTFQGNEVAHHIHNVGGFNNLVSGGSVYHLCRIYIIMYRGKAVNAVLAFAFTMVQNYIIFRTISWFLSK